MSSTPKGHFGLTTHRIHGFRKHKADITEGLALQYLHLAESDAAPNTRALAEIFRVERLAADGRYTEALLALDAALAAQPGSLRLQMTFPNLLNYVASRVESLGQLRPESAEYGHAYELLVELGSVPMSMHLSAIFHYALVGKPKQALDVAVKLRSRAPNYPGLEEAIAMAFQKQEEK